MSLSSAKAKLDAQGGDPVTGYISKTDHQQSYDELVDDTALTGATTAEALDVTGALTAGTVASDGTVAGTGLAGGLLSAATPVINGTAAAGTSAIPSRQDHVHASDTTKVTKAASSTDNALARFDGTGGDVVQNSGITVDDSGNVTSNLTISKASARFEATGSGTSYVIATSSSAAAYFLADTPAGQTNGLRYQTGGVLRWLVSKNATAEGGSNAGSDWSLVAYDDAGASLGTRLTVTRSTGKTTLGSVGATAGLELGASGPRVMSGTGSPEGVVTAPVGSTWIDTNATTGAIKWIKASGTGNTGWVVEYGNTGRRVLATGDITAATNVTATTSGFWLHRIGNTVTATLALTAGATIPSDTAWCNVAAGFRPTATLWGTSGYGLAAAWTLAAAGNFVVYTSVAAGAFRVSLSYLTTDAWPASLPGSAI